MPPKRTVIMGVALAALVAVAYLCSRPFTPRSRSDMMFGRGFWLYRQGQVDEAVEMFTGAIAINPDNTVAFFNRGQAYADQGDVQAALDDYAVVLDRHPDYVEALVVRGKLYVDVGQYEAAIADLSRAVTLKPHLADAYYYRAQAYDALGDRQAAHDDYRLFLDNYGLDDEQAAQARRRITELE